jgi:HD-GYP domain-containing protein (c-di-GMP phosphodiesterase class II)
MRTEYDFFMIERDHLKGKSTFPFQIFVFNPTHKKYSMFLNGNRPLTKELDSFLDYLMEKGGKIAILKKQRRTFLTAQDYNESDIPSLQARELHALEKERIMNFKLKEMYDEKVGAFHFQTEFELACEKDNFEKIIEHARMEILTFSVTHSHTVSLALELSKKHLLADNFVNRIVAVSYLLAKAANIIDQTALADIICGAYLSHIGFTQIPLSLVKPPTLNLFDKEKKNYEKHTILGNHLIKKSGIEISERAKRIVLDHHERVMGNGYPGMKTGDAIESLSLIVGSVAHLFEFSSGKVNGSKLAIKSIIISMKNKSFTPGLETDFGDKVYNSIVTLINTDKIETKNDSKKETILEEKKAA